MAEQVKLTANNVESFTNWLKKFSLIDKSLLFEIDEGSKEFIAKSYNEERSVVKMSQITFDDAGMSAKDSEKNPKRIKFGIYDISKFIKILDHFQDEFEIVFKYDEVLSDQESEYAGTSILLKSKTLKISIECTSLNIFKYIPDNMFKNKVAKVSAKTIFELGKENIQKINSLCSLDKDYKFMEFLNDKNKVFAKSKTFELFLEKSDTSDDIKLDILKDQFTKIDLEDYKVELGDDRLVFSSTKTDTITVISEVEKDERYDEKSEI